MSIPHDEGEHTWHTAETGFCHHGYFPFGCQVRITTSVYFIYNVGCVFANAWGDDGKKINVIFHCVVLDAELETCVINKMDERLLKIRHVSFKSFL